jgi:hypothetical protein
MADPKENYLEGKTGYLLVKIDEDAASSVAGGVFAIPEKALEQFRIEADDLTNLNEFEENLPEPKRIFVDFAVFRPDVLVRGSGG